MVDLLSVGGLLLAFFLVLMNGLFVAAAFAFVKVRPTQIDARVQHGNPGAGLVSDAIETLDDYLAVSPLGRVSEVGDQIVPHSYLLRVDAVEDARRERFTVQRTERSREVTGETSEE